MISSSRSPQGLSRASLSPVFLAALLILAGGPSGFGQQGTAGQEPSVRLPPELARVLTDYEAAWRARDAAALAALFVEDGFVLPSGHPPVRGRPAIARYYAGHGGPLALRAISFAAEGKVGTIIGGFAPRAGDPDVGKFTLTLRRESDGRWMIASDMDNSNRKHP